MSLEKPEGTLIVGHRGLPLEFPDNTLEGIRAAVEVCDMVEIDVRRTREGTAVLAHDARIGRRPIIDMDWPTLKELDLGGGVHPVRLDDVLGQVSGIPFNFEIKNSPTDPDFDETFAFACTAAARATDRDIVTSFHWPTVDAIRSAHPHLVTGLLVARVRSFDDAIEWACRAGHEVIAPHWRLLRKRPEERIAGLRERGLRVVVWTVNDGTMAQRVARGGAAGIITDDPVRIRSALQEAG